MVVREPLKRTKACKWLSKLSALVSHEWRLLCSARIEGPYLTKGCHALG